jgi:hypothetical protein
MFTIGASCEGWLVSIDEFEDDKKVEDVGNELVDESVPSQEAIRITNGKKMDKRFIIRNFLDD